MYKTTLPHLGKIPIVDYQCNLLRGNTFSYIALELLQNLKKMFLLYYIDSDVINRIKSSTTHFLVILKYLLRNYWKILKKCFLGTTCIDICLACSNPPPHTGV